MSPHTWLQHACIHLKAGPIVYFDITDAEEACSAALVVSSWHAYDRDRHKECDVVLD
jgi:hypothetical protein